MAKEAPNPTVWPPPALTPRARTPSLLKSRAVTATFWASMTVFSATRATACACAESTATAPAMLSVPPGLAATVGATACAPR